jgi:hypothetical protein
MSLTRVHDPLSLALVRRLGDAGGPRADQIAAELDSIIAGVNDAGTAFSFSFPIPDPSTPTVNAVIPGTAKWICPDGTSVNITKIAVSYDTGSHTSGGSVTFSVQKRTAASGWTAVTTIGSISLDNTNSGVVTVYTNNITDEPMAPGDTLIAFISARSGTVTERTVTVFIIGTQKLTT